MDNIMYMGTEELLYCLLPVEDVRKVLDAFGSLNVAFNKSAKDIEIGAGISEENAFKLASINEYSRRLYQEEKFIELTKHYTPDAMGEYVLSKLNNLEKEQMWVFLFDSKYQEKDAYVDEEMISQGGAYGTNAHPMDVFRKAIRLQASKIVLAHNHPSGDLSPSKNDIVTTMHLRRMGLLLGIDVIDHFIVGGGRYYSLQDNGKINWSD